MNTAQQSCSVEARMQQLLARPRQIGPNLAELRRQQDEAGIREVYDLGHLERLLWFEARKSPRSLTKVLCHQIHGNCCSSLDCSTCHFCRQKTVDKKTFCRCGGACGVWCSNCLYLRMGENVNEVLPLCAKGQWTCPACRDICNCSDIRCLRLSRGLGTTGQLIHEARHCGFKSVAHYLILTAVDRNAPRQQAGLPRPQPQYRPQPAQQQHTTAASRRSRIQQAAQDYTRRMLQQCQAAFAQQQGHLIQRVAGTSAGAPHHFLDAAGDDDGEELQTRGGRLINSRSAAPQVPAMFSGARAGAGGMGSPRHHTNGHQQQQQQQQNDEPSLQGVSNGPLDAAADETLAPSAPGTHGLLGLLGLDVPTAELGVLGVPDSTMTIGQWSAAAAATPVAGSTTSAQQHLHHCAPCLPESTGQEASQQQVPGAAQLDSGAHQDQEVSWLYLSQQCQAPNRPSRDGAPVPGGHSSARPATTPAAAAGRRRCGLQAADGAQGAPQHGAHSTPVTAASAGAGAGAATCVNETHAERQAYMNGPDTGAPDAGRCTAAHLQQEEQQQQQQQQQQQPSEAQDVCPVPEYTAGASGCLDQAAQLQLDLELEIGMEGIGPTGMPYNELCERLQRLQDLALYANTDFDDVPAVISMPTGAAHTGSTCDLGKVQGVCAVLLFISKYGPPDRYEEALRRLTNKEPFVSFAGSDGLARTHLLQVAVELLFGILLVRRQPGAAVYESWVAAGSPDPLPGANGVQAVQQLTTDALLAMSLAEQGMEELVDCLIEWMTVIHQEVAQVQGLLRGHESIIMGPLQLGPLQWQQQQSGWTSTLQKDDDLLLERQCRLDGLQQINERLLTNLATVFARTAQSLSRKLASKLLSAPVVAQLLDTQVAYSPQARKEFLAMVLTLVRRAAPDLHNTSQWLVEDVSVMQQSLPVSLQQQQQHSSSWQHLSNNIQLQHYSLTVLQQLSEQQLGLPARQQELSALCSAAVPQLLRPVEQLVAAEYCIRSHGSRSLRLADNGVVGPVKVEVLAALYALLLQTGSCSWRDIERCIVQPADNFTSFLRHSSFKPHHKRFVLFLTAEMLHSAPSLLQWHVAPVDSARHVHTACPGRQASASDASRGCHPQATGAVYPSWSCPGSSTAPAAASAAAGPSSWLVDALPAPTGVPSAVSAVTLLRMWLRSILDQHGKAAFASCMAHVSSVLASAPATKPLFERCSSAQWMQQPELLATALSVDCGSQQAGHARGLFTSRLLRAVATLHGPGKLAEVLSGIHLDLAAWQQMHQQDSTRGLAKVLGWQRNCMPAVLAIAELVVQHPVVNVVLPLGELMKLLTLWVQDGITAACSSKGHMDNLRGTGRGGSLGNSSTPWSDAVQGSALRHLPPYLGLLVHLAGRAGLFEDVSTTQWPTAPLQASSSSSSINQTLHYFMVSSGSGALPEQLRGQVKELMCLRDVLGTAVYHLSAQDQLTRHEAALVDCLVCALAQQSGLSQEQPRTQGYASPGLLHHVLGLHVHAMLKAAADRGTDLDVHRAVNALHLVKGLLVQLLQPAVSPASRQCTQQLLLPCLSSPLLEVLKATQGRCPRVQQQAFQLMQQLLTAPAALQLLPEPGREVASSRGPVQFADGALIKINPVSQAQLQDIMHHLLHLCVHTCLVMAAAAPLVLSGHTSMPLQQQQQQAMDSPLNQQLQLQEQLVKEASSQFLRILGRGRGLPLRTVQYPGSLNPGQTGTAAGRGALPPHAPSAAVPVSHPAHTRGPLPEQTSTHWTALRTGLVLVAQAAQQHGAALQLVSSTLLPHLHSIMSSTHISWQPVQSQYRALLQLLPEEDRVQWELQDTVYMPPPNPLPQPAQQPVQQQQQHDSRTAPCQWTRAGQQPQREPPVAPHVPHPVQRQQQPQLDKQHPAAAAAVRHGDDGLDDCVSQACSAVGNAARQHGRHAAAGAGAMAGLFAHGWDASAPPDTHLHGVRQLPRNNQQVEGGTESHMPCATEGGRVASCAGPEASQVAGTAAAARASRKRASDPSSAGSGRGFDRGGDSEQEDDDCPSSSSARPEVQKKPRMELAGHVLGGLTQQLTPALPDVCSQDQDPEQAHVQQPRHRGVLTHTQGDSGTQDHQGGQQGLQTQQQGSGQEQRDPIASGCSSQHRHNSQQQQKQQQQLMTAVGYVGSCEVAEDKVRGVLVCTLKLRHLPQAIHLVGRLAYRAQELLEHNLLQADQAVILTRVVQGQHKKVQPTANSVLLVNPELARAAGVEVDPLHQQMFDRKQEMLQQNRDKYARRRQSMSSTALPPGRPPHQQHQHQAQQHQEDQQQHQARQGKGQQDLAGGSLQPQAPWQQQRQQEVQPQLQAAVASQAALQRPGAVVGDLGADVAQQAEQQVVTAAAALPYPLHPEDSQATWKYPSQR